jgi:DNA helicase INO80
MLGYWRRHEKEERDNRKRAEREALERAKIEDEKREAKRQQRKLNFLITQTELYAHFIAKNIAGEAGAETTEADILNNLTSGAADKTGADQVDILGDDEEDEDAMRERARRQAQEALRSQQDKTRAFDEQTRKAAQKVQAPQALTQEESMLLLNRISECPRATMFLPASRPGETWR